MRETEVIKRYVVLLYTKINKNKKENQKHSSTHINAPNKCQKPTKQKKFNSRMNFFFALKFPRTEREVLRRESKDRNKEKIILNP